MFKLSDLSTRLPSILSRLTLALLLVTNSVFAERLKDMSNISGQRPNQLVGYGLVVGLDGSGDQTTQTPFTIQSVLQMIGTLGITIPPGGQAQLRNTAAVMITAEMPALARPGQAIDITVSSLGNAQSLKGGTLLMSPLRAADGQVYAQAQGNVVISGAGAAGGGASTTVNHLSAGRVPSGALIERAVPSVMPEEFIQIDLKTSDFSAMQKTAEAIGKRFGVGTAIPLDARSLNVRVPMEPLRRIAFMSELENLNIEPSASPAKVILNSRTGSVVMNDSVKLAPSAIAHGNLTVRIQSTPEVSQPNAFSRGETAVTSQDTATITSDGKPNSLITVPKGASLASVVKALNMLGATPSDLISILQSLKSAGSLSAELEVI